MRWRSWFRREKKQATKLLRDPIAVVRAADSAGRKAQQARGPLGRIWNDLQTAIRLVRAWGRRDYRGVSRGSIVLVVGGLLYLLSPIDAIIDAIPGLGFVDDALVLTWVFGQVRSELDVFREWEQQQQLAATDVSTSTTAALPS